MVGWVLTKIPRTHNMKRTVSSINSAAGESRYQHAEECKQTFISHHIQKPTQSRLRKNGLKT
jgi:hypothetical protein